MAVDPNDVKNVFRLANIKTRTKYLQSWRDFVQFSGISYELAPTEDHFSRHFAKRREDGLCGNTLWSLYSHLNKVYEAMYNAKLQRWPRITDQLKSYVKGEKVKKAAVFSREELETFISQGDNTDRYLLVRKAVAVVAFCGGHRGDELRRLLIKDVRPVKGGYRVNYRPAKLRGHIKHHEYSVPFRPDESENGVCWGSVLKIYLETLNEDLPQVDNDGHLFFTAKQKTAKGRSKFISGPIGVNSLRNIGKEIAEYLKLENADGYTGHCFRRSAATEAANNGATEPQLKVHFGWTNAKMALEYIENSIPQQNKMAKLLTGYTPDVSVVKKTSVASLASATKNPVLAQPDNDKAPIIKKVNVSENHKATVWFQSQQAQATSMDLDNSTGSDAALKNCNLKRPQGETDDSRTRKKPHFQDSNGFNSVSGWSLSGCSVNIIVNNS